MKRKMTALAMTAVMAVPLAGQMTVKAEETPKLTIFVDETWWPYEKWEGAVPEEFASRVGADIEVIRAADGIRWRYARYYLFKSLPVFG